MNIYRERRAKLMAQLGKDAVLILPSQTIKVRNGDVEYPFRQDSDFFYLTGFNEANALLVLIPGRTAGEFILFNEPKDEAMERSMVRWS